MIDTISIPFFKYQGAGNDFVMIDNREKQWLQQDDEHLIKHLCNRYFGIGADGLILLQENHKKELEMVYFNADGRVSSMCGNGGRCFVAFARHIGLIANHCQFLAVDGMHDATINQTGNWVELKMQNVSEIYNGNDHYVLDTGSPHYVSFVSDIKTLDVMREGRAVRYSDTYTKEGINVNFITIDDDNLNIATYERGVEAETLACGTGVTAAAIAFFMKCPSKANFFLENGGIPVRAKGGDLKVRFQTQQGKFTNIWLCGPAEYVFEGQFKRTF